jgi:uncharacterized protein
MPTRDQGDCVANGDEGDARRQEAACRGRLIHLLGLFVRTGWCGVAVHEGAMVRARHESEGRIVRGAAVQLGRSLSQSRPGTAGAGPGQRLPDEGFGEVSARHPYRLTPARRLAEASIDRHIADLVQLVLLTGMRERLHHPDFGAGLGSTVLFEPLDQTLRGLVQLRARGSLDAALGDRVDVLDVTIDVPQEATLRATVTYRLRASGRPTTTEVRTRVG